MVLVETILASRVKLHGKQQWSPREKQVLDRVTAMYGEALHWSGIPLINHVQSVANILRAFSADEEIICACLLQFALRNKYLTMQAISEEFGPTIRKLVSGIYLLSHVTLTSKRRSIDDLRLMLVRVSEDPRVLLTVLCNRVFVLEQLIIRNHPDVKKYASDVLNLFAPVAGRLGIHSLKQTLEHMAFPILYPADAEHIQEQLDMLKKKQGDFLDASAEELRRYLRDQGISAVVYARQKQPYSIFSKMRAKSFSSIESLPDLYATRVLVEQVDDCYRVLGLLHGRGRPMQNRFKDYIAFPKPNGYRSLHTTLSKMPAVPDGVAIEIQIRTHAMHREAEYGIAAHWSYKEGGGIRKAVQRVQLQEMLKNQEKASGDQDQERLLDHIFALTPKGDIVELAEGATPLDFAFQIHTTLGLAFRAARVNGAIVSLDHALEDGDVVEILTHRVPQPSAHWMQVVKMSSSRAKLRRYLQSMDTSLLLEQGRKVLNAELERRGFPALDPELSVLRRIDARHVPFREREEIVAKIGQGGDRLSTLLHRVDALRVPVVALRPKNARGNVGINTATIQLDDGLPMPLKYAKCCDPQGQSDIEILGIINRQGVVMVHRSDCSSVAKSNPQRQVKLRRKKAAEDTRKK